MSKIITKSEFLPAIPKDVYFTTVSLHGRVYEGRDLHDRLLSIDPCFKYSPLKNKHGFNYYMSTGRYDTLVKRWKTVLISPDGVKFEVGTASKFAKEHGLNTASLSLLINDQLAHAKGWTCENPRTQLNPVRKGGSDEAEKALHKMMGLK